MKQHKILVYILGSYLLMVTASCHAIGNQISCWTSFTHMAKKSYGMATYVISWPFKKAGALFFDGALGQAQQALIPAGVPGQEEDKEPLDENMNRVVGAFFRALNNATDEAHNEEGTLVVRNLINAGARSVADLYNPDGDGRRALENIIRSLREFIREHGVVREMVQDVRHLISEEFIQLLREFELLNRENGEARAVVRAVAENIAEGVEHVGHAVAENISQSVDRVGDSVDTSSRKIIRNLLIGSVATISSWFLWREFERKLICPRLVLETSYQNPLERLQDLIFGSAKQPIPAMIFSKDLEQRLVSLSLATQSIRNKIRDGDQTITFRNLLLWGPPGTGKTMFARLLAFHSGMDYAIMSGASFSQFKNGEGITQMNKLFDWAQSTPNGVILFIDEAESFLGGREGKNVSEDSYLLLTNFLNLTGLRSRKIMLIFATNNPQVLDPAVKRRTDDAIEMPLPAEQERQDILRLYRDALITSSPYTTDEMKKSAHTFLSDAALSRIACDTAGLSGGELESIINTSLSDASVNEDGCLTQVLIDKVVKQAQEKHHSFTHGFQSLHERIA